MKKEFFDTSYAASCSVSSQYVAIDILIAYGMYQRLKDMITYNDAVWISRDRRFEHCKLFDKTHCEK